MKVEFLVEVLTDLLKSVLTLTDQLCPQISWYRVGEPDTALPALELPGRTRAQPSQAVLAIVPRKEDDASDYRCTVWNRAMPETELMETSTSINVNCEYIENDAMRYARLVF